MFHCISDQTQYNSHLEVRNDVVSNIYRMIHQNIIFWDDSELIIDYIERMELDCTFGDQYALQVIVCKCYGTRHFNNSFKSRVCPKCCSAKTKTTTTTFSSPNTHVVA